VSLLDQIKSPNDLKSLDLESLEQVAEELRQFIIDSISQTGGHFASNLGTVELTVALHKVFDSPRDKIIWDVGHQAYPHKILTGRKDRFHTLRQYKGLSGFLRREESPHDAFGAGHSSTSISAALGFALARDHQKEDYKCIAVIGDGALTAGMAFEALNNAGDLKRDLIIVLNDNKMSISPNVGAISRYLNRIITGDFYNVWKARLNEIQKKIPKYGTRIRSLINRFEEGLKGVIVPGVLFEELGLRYFGPIDGHNLEHLIEVFENIKYLKAPRIVHVITMKGKGYNLAERDPLKWHGPPKTQFYKVMEHEAQEASSDKPREELKKESTPPAIPTFTQVFGDLMCELAGENPNVIAITAAMCSGTGLDKFAVEYPDRFYDCGIAEQHAVTMAGGLALGGMRPIAAIYSTFMQRAYDQVAHDICLQDIPIIFAMDRAGIVGADGATHQGLFDIAYLRMLPNMILMAPTNELEMHRMFRTALQTPHPCGIRYPRGKATGIPLGPESKKPLEVGKAEVLHQGREVAILVYGSILADVEKALPLLNQEGLSPTLVNARFAKPLDRDLIVSLVTQGFQLVTVEEHVLAGGFGSAVMELLQQERMTDEEILCLGIPDRFIEHGDRESVLSELDLAPEDIARRILEFHRHPHGRKTLLSHSK